MAASSVVIPEVTLVMQDALDHLLQVMSADEISSLGTITLDNVVAAARELDKVRAKNLANPNTGHLKHLFDAFKRLQKLFDGIDGYPSFVPWLWAPVKRALEITAPTSKPLVLLLAAYKRIATSIPDRDRMTVHYLRSAEGQRSLSSIYADVLEFHRRVHQSLSKPGWTLFFDSWWDHLDSHLQLILEDIARHAQLLYSAASSDQVDAAKQERERKLEDLAKKEKLREGTELQNVHTWLKASHLDQEDHLDEIQSKCHEDTCDWINHNVKIKSWLRTGLDHTVLWLKGKPGSGKSVLCSKLIEHMTTTSKATVLYFFCSETRIETKDLHSLLRGLVRQLVMKNHQLCTYIEKVYVDKGLLSSQKQLRSALHTLLRAFDTVRIVVDGLDECGDTEQKAMIRELVALTGLENPSRFCKVLIVSQDTSSIARSLQDRSVIDLNHEHVAVDRAIASFIRAKVAQSPLFSDIEKVNEESLKQAEKTLLNKADGMFLYVQLVITMLERAYSPEEVQTALSDLPDGLNKIYEKICLKIQEKATERNSDRVKRIFQWLVCSQRPIKTFELQDAITLHPGNQVMSDETRDTELVFELCKPLVEVGVTRVVRFVHVSVKLYLLDHATWLDLPTAHFHAAFSCLSYLDLGLQLIDDQNNEASLLVEIGKGFHGLCQYSTRYWLEHLLACMETVVENPTSSQRMVVNKAENLAQLLLSEHDNGQAGSSAGKDYPVNRQHQLEVRLKCLEGYISVHKLARWTLVERLRGLIAPRSNKIGTKHPMSEIKANYEKLVAKLLNANEVSGLDAKQLAAFKETFRSTMLVCRFANCTRAFHGFETPQQRDDHEKTHSKFYQCPHSDCSWHRTGFVSPQKLKTHLEQFHPVESSTASQIPSIRPFGTPRNLTGATLVGTPPATGSDQEKPYDSFSEGEDAEEVEEEITYGKLWAFAETDSFALGSTSFT